MHKKRTAFALVAVAFWAMVPMLTACSSGDEASSTQQQEKQQEQGPAVNFSAMIKTEQKATTRTPANAINSNKVLSEKGGFGVFACYTGLYKYLDSNVHPDFMYNEHVTSTDDGETWTYSPLKYWPNGEGNTDPSIITGENPHYVSFMAYAPYSDNMSSLPGTNPVGYCIPTISKQGDVGNPWLTYRLIPQEYLDSQVDLLYDEQLDLKKLQLGEKVVFNFRHALACVGDRVTIVCADGLKEQINNRVTTASLKDAKVVVKNLSIKYTLTSKGRNILWNNGEANWQLITSEDPTCERTRTLIDTDTDVYKYTDQSIAETIWHKGVYYIPLEQDGYPQTAEVFITYCTSSTADGVNWSNSAVHTVSSTILMKDYVEAYKSGKHLYINVILGEMGISLTAAIEPWDDVQTSEIPVDTEG